MESVARAHCSNLPEPVPQIQRKARASNRENWKSDKTRRGKKIIGIEFVKIWKRCVDTRRKIFTVRSLILNNFANFRLIRRFKVTKLS